MTHTVEVKDTLPSDVSAQRVAKVYAMALLKSGARASGEAIVRELEDLVAMLQGAPKLTAFFTRPTIPAKVKTEALKKSLVARASKGLGDFLLVLNDHGRFELLRLIAQEARRLVDRQALRIKVFVTSAVPLPPDQVERLAQQVRDVIQMEPQLVLAVDPELLGGFIFRAGDWKFDASTRTQLRLIRQQIIARSSYEIQSGRDRFRTSA